MLDSTRFAGRDDLVVEAFEYLQNDRSIFITGERGVGKSSFAMQIKKLINNEEIAFNRFGINKESVDHDSVLVNYRCTGRESFHEIIVNLLTELSKKIDKDFLKIERISKKWAFNLKIISQESQVEKSIPTPSITKKFSDIVIDLFNKDANMKNKCISFMIDEIDTLINKIELGVFIKVFLENLSDAGIQNVTFILIGIRNGLSSLEAQHPSISRYLIPVYVPTMRMEEINEIINRALSETGVEFDDEIRKAIHMLSRGFPDPVHLFGYELFDQSRRNNNKIDDKVFYNVMRKIVTSIKKEEFISIKNKIPNRDCERLLLEMAKFNEEIIGDVLISKRLEIEVEECREIFNKLIEHGFIEQHGVGAYGFSDPLFRIYMNMINVEQEARAEKANLFIELNKMSKQLVKNEYGDETNNSEKLLFEIIARNWEETGKTGFGG